MKQTKWKYIREHDKKKISWKLKQIRIVCLYRYNVASSFDFYQPLSTSRHVHWQHFLSPTRRGINETHLHGNIRTLGRRVVELSLKKSSRVGIDEFIAVTRRKSVRNYVDILLKPSVLRPTKIKWHALSKISIDVYVDAVRTKANIFWRLYEWRMKNVGFLGCNIHSWP